MITSDTHPGTKLALKCSREKSVDGFDRDEVTDPFQEFISQHREGFGLKTLGAQNVKLCPSLPVTRNRGIWFKLIFLFKPPGKYFASRVILQSKDIYFPSWGKSAPLQVTCFCEKLKNKTHTVLMSPLGPGPHAIQVSPHLRRLALCSGAACVTRLGHRMMPGKSKLITTTGR